MSQKKQSQTQGDSFGDECITYEIGRNKPKNLADWLNGMDASSKNRRRWKATLPV